MDKLLIKGFMNYPGSFWARINHQYFIVIDRLQEYYGNNLEIIFAENKSKLSDYPLCDIYYNVGEDCLKYLVKNRKFIKFIVSGSGSSHPHSLIKNINPEIELFFKHPEKFEGVKVDTNEYSRLFNKSRYINALALYEISDYIFVPGKYTAQTFIDGGVPEEKMFILTYSVDPEKFKRTRKRSDVFTIFFAGGDKLRKGERFVLEALKQLDFEYRYINGYNASMYEQVFNESHIAVLPSFEEGLPVTLLECMAYEVPFITSYNMSFAEYFDLEEISYGKRGLLKNKVYEKDDNDGFIYKRDEQEITCGFFVDLYKDNIVTALADFLKHLYWNQNYIHEFYGESCREVIENQITWKKWQDNLFNFLSDKIERCK